MSDTVQSKTVVLSAGSLSIGIRRALSRCILPLIYVSTFILLHSYWKIKPVFNFEKYDRKREPFRRKGSLLRFWYHWEFRTLRSAPKGFALGTHNPFALCVSST